MPADRAGKFDAEKAAREWLASALSVAMAPATERALAQALREAFEAGVMAASDALAKREKAYAAETDRAYFDDRQTEVAWCGVIVRDLLEKGRGE